MEQRQQLSKLEIQTSLVDFYSADPYTRRCQDDAGTAVYNGRNGKHCAIGQCMTEKYQSKGRGMHYNTGTLDEIVEYFEEKTFDDMLQEQFRGHEIDFWEHVQNLHDRDVHWTETGISEAGLNKVKQIHNLFNL